MRRRAARPGSAAPLAARSDDKRPRPFNSRPCQPPPAAFQYLPGLVEPLGVYGIMLQHGAHSGQGGGTTTVFDYSGQAKGETLLETAKRRELRPTKTVPPWTTPCMWHHRPVQRSAGHHAGGGGLRHLLFQGIHVYDFNVKDGDFYQVLQKSKETGSLICVHAENKEVLTTLTDQLVAEGKLSPWYHYVSRPEFVAAEANRRAIAWYESWALAFTGWRNIWLFPPRCESLEMARRGRHAVLGADGRGRTYETE